MSSSSAVPDGPTLSGFRPWVAIVAMSENRVIGSAGSIPWHLPADFAWFKQVTRGQILVMGRKTFESIGRPLPGRRTIVISRRGCRHPEVDSVSSIDGLVRAIRTDPRLVFLCGGSEIYAQWLPLCSDLLLTCVRKTVEGDAMFPAFEDWFVPLAEVAENAEFRITHYVNRNRLRRFRGHISDSDI